MEAASPPLSFPVSAERGYGAAPPASKALRVATRRAYGPPLTPEPLRPLTAQRHGQEQSPCPPKRPALTTTSHQTKSLRFEGIARLSSRSGGLRFGADTVETLFVEVFQNASAGATATSIQAVRERIHVRSSEAEVVGYDGLTSAAADVVEVSSLDQATAELARAGREGRTVTLRASGASMHDQAIGADRVLLLGGLSQDVHVDGEPTAGGTVTVGPAALCGEVHGALVAAGGMLPTLPTSRRITLGGSLSADTLTRWSPFYGKLSRQLSSFVLYGPDGAVRHVTRPCPGTSALNDRLFRAVPGGFGLLGLIGDMTFVPVPTGYPPGPPPRVRTHITPTRGIDEHVELLIGRWLARTPATGAPGPVSMAAICTPWSVVDVNGVGGVLETELCASDEPLDRFFLHWCDTHMSRIVHLFGMFSVSTRIVAWANTIHRARPRVIIDELAPFSFMMDSNWSARKLAAKAGMAAWMMQQSFAVPLDRSAANPGRPLEKFLDSLMRLAHDHGLEMGAIDMLFLPEDDGLMSPVRGYEACLVTPVRQGVARGAVERVRMLFMRLSEVCASLGGRVSLTKHVHVDPDVFQQMYGSALIEFSQLRRELDPQHTLRSGLYDRLLGPVCAGQRIEQLRELGH